MMWTRSLKRSDLVEGSVFVHGMTRLNVAIRDLSMFVDPPDAALILGFRALRAGEPFEESFVVWMVTLRRRDAEDAIVESLQRVFTQLVDEASLAKVLLDTVEEARRLGYRKLWFVPALFKEPLLGPALKATSDKLGTPLNVVATSGMSALPLLPTT